MSDSQSQHDLETIQIKQQLINQLPSGCREVGKNFFNCVEENVDIFTKELVNPQNMSYEELERSINDKVIPICLEKFPVQKCVDQNP